MIRRLEDGMNESPELRLGFPIAKPKRPPVTHIAIATAMSGCWSFLVPPLKTIPGPRHRGRNNTRYSR
jgi:hypothetical protein